MAIKKYFANADNSITNAFDEALSTRGTGSNAGAADILETFSIYGQQTSSSVELSRILVQFPISDIETDRTAGTIPASGSMKFFLNLYNARHSSTLPKDFKITVNAISGSWQEGNGLDLDNYTDLTYDKIGSNWINAVGPLAKATATIDLTNDITLTASANGRYRNDNTFELKVAAAAANPTNTILAAFTGTPSEIVATITPNNGDNNGSSAVNLTTAEFTELINNGSVVGKTVTITDNSSLRALQTASGGGAQNLADSGEGDNVTAIFSSGDGKWVSNGGDYYTDLSSSFEQTFPIGTEDLSVDITTLVEQWLDSANNVLGSKNNNGVLVKLSSSYEGSSSVQAAGDAVISYYTKKFFGKDSEFFFKRPSIEARWDSTLKDHRGNFFLSSSLAPSGDNLNSIYLYNYVRGKLTNIPSVGTGEIHVSLFSGSSDNTAPSGSALLMSLADPHIKQDYLRVTTGSWVSTGIYSASIAFTGSTDLETVYDVWFKGGNTIIDAATATTGENAAIQFHTGSIEVQTLAASNINPNGKYVVSMPDLKEFYSNNETERFRIYVREKNWSPNIFTKAQATPQTLIIESASYQITRVVDQKVVVPYGTGSNDDNYSMLSYDISGNYFDLDLSMFEPGYTYAFQYSFYEDSVSSYRQHPHIFKFRVNKDEY